MQTNRCQQLRSALTSYVDHEGSEGEWAAVEEHLTQCEACRRILNRESAVRQRLQDWSAEARAEGAPLLWSSASGRRFPTVGALGIATIAAVGVIALILWNRGRVDTGAMWTANGQISDSRCAGDHMAEVRNITTPDCVHRCVEMGARYVFVAGGIVYPISNQEFEDLTRFAGEDVQIEGELHEHVLTVSRVRRVRVGRAATSQGVGGGRTS